MDDETLLRVLFASLVIGGFAGYVIKGRLRDERRLRLRPGDLVRLMFYDRSPPKIYHEHEYWPKMLLLGAHAPVHLRQPFGPHKVKVSSKVVFKADDRRSRNRKSKR